MSNSRGAKTQIPTNFIILAKSFSGDRSMIHICICIHIIYIYIQIFVHVFPSQLHVRVTPPIFFNSSLLLVAFPSGDISKNLSHLLHVITLRYVHLVIELDLLLRKLPTHQTVDGGNPNHQFQTLLSPILSTIFRRSTILIPSFWCRISRATIHSFCGGFLK